jgi:hypothetical protein
MQRSSERTCTTSLCFNHTSIVSVCERTYMHVGTHVERKFREEDVSAAVCWQRAHSWQSSFIVVCRYVFYYFPGNVYFAPSFARGVIPPNDINFQLLRLTSSACSPQRDIKSILQAWSYSCKIPSELGSCRTLIFTDNTANMRTTESPIFQMVSSAE